MGVGRDVLRSEAIMSAEIIFDPKVLIDGVPVSGTGRYKQIGRQIFFQVVIDEVTGNSLLIELPKSENAALQQTPV